MTDWLNSFLVIECPKCYTRVASVQARFSAGVMVEYKIGCHGEIYYVRWDVKARIIGGTTGDLTMFIQNEFNRFVRNEPAAAPTVLVRKEIEHKPLTRPKRKIELED